MGEWTSYRQRCTFIRDTLELGNEAQNGSLPIQGTAGCLNHLVIPACKSSYHYKYYLKQHIDVWNKQRTEVATDEILKYEVICNCLLIVMFRYGFWSTVCTLSLTNIRNISYFTCKLKAKWRCILVGKNNLKFNRPFGTLLHPKHTNTRISADHTVLNSKHLSSFWYIPLHLSIQQPSWSLPVRKQLK